ncbi:haloacid dehalogenase type II|uniref:haloacid dehalogenase type II n=1 Tax=Pseudomonas sp. SbOxS1 TaxID=2723884 RepID=UPI0015D3BB69|nr:haloacid dehalogenase type II [Pseudomonas sp. SbOxS1]NYU03038.1 haloacid dehalogenase type II [Pseudomonas sp. SbOxS1]
MLNGEKPTWLTFDCYGTLIQWDEGVRAALTEILEKRGRTDIAIKDIIAWHDGREHELEQSVPFMKFRQIVSMSFIEAMAHFGVTTDSSDFELLLSRISAMPPFPEVVAALTELKSMGFKLCIVSNTEDAVIAGNVAQLGGAIDRVITAEQAQAYKPNPQLFNHAYRELGIDKSDVVHICASPLLDLTAARDMGFRCVWIDRGTGRKAPHDYTPNAVLPDLSQVPRLFKSLGW